MWKLFVVVFFVLALTLRSYAFDSLAEKMNYPQMATHDPFNNDSNWTWGVFYHSKEDNRMFPHKRSGRGWTVNFANANADIILVVGLGIIIVTARYSKRNRIGDS